MKRLCLAAALVVLAGCGMKDRLGGLLSDDDTGIPPTPLAEFTPTVTIGERWGRGVGKGTDELFVRLEPAIEQGVVYIAERGGRVSAIGLDDGRPLWRTDTDARLSGGPGLGEGLVLVGSSDGEVIALDADGGRERWRAEVSSEVLAAPRAERGIAVARTGDGKLFGLTADAGARLWVYDRTVPVLTLRGSSPPVLVDDLVLAGFDNGRLVALELLTGKLVWEAQVAVPRGRSDLERMVDLDAEPVVYGRSVYAATFQGRVAAISLLNGEIEWTRDISSAAGLGVDVSSVYVTDEDSVIWALDRRSGVSLWKQDGLKARLATAPAVTGEHIVLGDLDGYLHWLQRQDGAFAARLRLDKSRIIVPPRVVDDTVIAYSMGGRLAAFGVR